MKRLCLCVLFILGLYVLCGCSSRAGNAAMEEGQHSAENSFRSETDEDGHEEIIHNTSASSINDKIKMVPSVESDGNLVITITNESNEVVETGRDFVLNIEKDGIWHEVQLPFVFTEDIVSIEPLGEHSLEYATKGLVVFEQGNKYQVVKTISVNGTNHEMTAILEP